MKLEGSMMATISMVLWAQWQAHQFQTLFLTQWMSAHLVQRITATMQKNLKCWTSLANLLNCHSLITVHWIVVESDASETGWGAVCQGHTAQGVCTGSQQGVVSNILELRVVFEAMVAFCNLIWGPMCF